MDRIIRNHDLVCAPWRLAHQFDAFLILPRSIKPERLRTRYELHRWSHRCYLVRPEEVEVGISILHEIQDDRAKNLIVPYEPPTTEDTSISEMCLAILNSLEQAPARHTLAILFDQDQHGLDVAKVLGGHLVTFRWLHLTLTRLHHASSLSDGILITREGSLIVFPAA